MQPNAQSQQQARPSASTKLWTPSFIIGTLTNFVLLVNYYMLMVVMTSYVLDAYDAPPAVAAFSASVFIIGTLVARMVSGSIMERIGRKRILLIGAAFEIAFSCAYMLGAALPLLIAVRLAHGLAYGTCSTALTTIVTSMVPHARKGEGVGYYMLSVTLGAAIGPSLGIFVMSNFDFHLLFAGAAATAVLALLGAASLKPDMRPANTPAVKTRFANDAVGNNSRASVLAAEAQAEEAPEMGTPAEDASAADFSSAMGSTAGFSPAIASTPNGEQSERVLAERAPAREEPCTLPNTDQGATAKTSRTLPNTSERATATTSRTSFIAKVIEVPVVPISLVCGLIFFGYSSLLTFLTPYASEIGQTQAASFFFIAYALIMFVTRPFTGRAFDRKGPRVVMMPAFVSFAAGMVVLGLAENGWMIIGAALLLGFGVGTVQSSGLAMAVRITPDERLSLANSTFYVFLDAGVGVGPLILGLLAPLVGYGSLFLIMAAVALGAAGLYLAIEKRHS